MFKKKKEDLNDGTAVIVNEVGAIEIKTFKMTEKGENVILDFGPSEKLIQTLKSNIRVKRVLIFKNKNGYFVQNPDNWKNVLLQEYGIKQLRFNLQNFSLQEAQSAIHRWTLSPDLIKKLTPFIKLLMICVVVGVGIWAAFKFSGTVFSTVIADRVKDCSSILPHAINPMGVSNVTAPIG